MKKKRGGGMVGNNNNNTDKLKINSQIKSNKI